MMALGFIFSSGVSNFLALLNERLGRAIALPPALALAAVASALAAAWALPECLSFTVKVFKTS
ncbi:MAG: hypothetical protein AB2693_32145 [Candidatus Thiodiazotropha sp.]